jgi:uncharacterized protein (TIGR02266 family)
MVARLPSRRTRPVVGAGATAADPLAQTCALLAEASAALRDAGPLTRPLVRRLENVARALANAPDPTTRRGSDADDGPCAEVATAAARELAGVLRVLRGDQNRVTEHPVAPLVATAIRLLAPLCCEAERAPVTSRAERRSGRRAEIRTDVGFDTETHFFKGFSEDLSSGGLFVATYTRLAVGTEVTVHFALPTGHRVAADGCVVWPRDSANAETTPGVAVRFEGLAAGDEEGIHEFLRQREAIFYDV